MRVQDTAVSTTAAAHQEATKFYHVAQVATLLNVHRTTVYRAIKSGELTAVRFGQGRGGLRVPASALTNYVAAAEVRPAELAEVA